jgi:RNA polymerase sigma-70 factor, ECF subfamily
MHPERSRQPGPPDATLVEAALGNDRDAFRILLTRHTPRLRQRLAGCLRSPALVDDAAQDACVIAWRRLDKLHKPAAFGSWLSGIGERVVRKRYRQSRTDVMSDADSLDADGAADVDTGATPYSELEQRAVLDRLRREIHALPEHYASVLEMYYERELSCAEIADCLQISLANVHQRLSRGRDILGKELAPKLGAIAPAGALGTPGMARSQDAFIDAVMRAVRKQPRPRPRKAGRASAAGTAGGLAAWGVALGTAVAVIAVLALSADAVLSAVHAVREALSGASADPPSHARPRKSRSPVHIPGPPGLFGAAPAGSGEAQDAPQLDDNDAPEPDYVVRSESTDVKSALFGAHKLRPMDGYGQQLYDGVSNAFVMHFALCVRSNVVGDDDRSQIDVELRFALWRDPTRTKHLRNGIATADERDVTYWLAGLELSNIQKFEFSQCVQNAFYKTAFPAPPDGTPRVIQHLITVDFGAITGQIEALFASVP